MDHKKIEAKWRAKWEKEKLYKYDPKGKGDKFYMLEMFSYPSGAKLHIGHWYNYGVSDSYARYKKMCGFNVFHPVGFDAFGLPAENYAIKTGVHPKDSTEKNIATMETQLKAMGASFDWNHELRTCDPEYYKWTQWLFLQLYKRGLAYRKQSPVNFCPSCQTVIANEQVIDGKCERCSSEVEHRHMDQWFFKITDYADRLLEGLDGLDWPEKTKTMQRNWIGRSEGGEVDFALDNSKNISVFTTRADTLFGVSYVVLAPEHPLVGEITTDECAAAVKDYAAQAAKKDEIERLSVTKDKTGAFTGAYCTNPVNGERVPIYVSDYVLVTYGTGAVMAVPAHDTRDFEFAQKFNLPVRRVIESASGESELPFTDYGVMTNSGEFNGMTTEEGKIAVIKKLEKEGKGRLRVNYRMRDWSVSRQRYWGAPIPIIYCPDCGAVPVPESDLPVLLPYNVNFTPDGKSPLSKSAEFQETVCPVCGKKARRESDTLDTFVCSSWYELRYIDNKNSKKAFDPKKANALMPVDKYVGGPEHACGHLLYSRFITKVLYDAGYLDCDEPFKSLVHQGIILGPDGMRMSKSHGNVISPDVYIEEYGSDALRLYIMFGFKYIEGGAWSDDGIKAISSFIKRMERLVMNVVNETEKDCDGELDYDLNYCISQMRQDIDEFGFNTAVARLMELVNAMYRYDAKSDCDRGYLKHVAVVMTRLLAPLAPYTAEEFYQLLGYTDSVFKCAYPTCNASKLVKSTVEIAIQINSKVKCRATIESGMSDEKVIAAVRALPQVKELLTSEPKKSIVIKDRLVNFVL